MAVLFRCSHSGLFFPPDYTKEWGRKYGIGLGPVPVSCVMDTHYHLSPGKDYQGREMHPVGVSGARIDAWEVPDAQANDPAWKAENMAILPEDDPGMMRVTDVVVAKQRAHKLAEATARVTALGGI